MRLAFAGSMTGREGRRITRSREPGGFSWFRCTGWASEWQKEMIARCAASVAITNAIFLPPRGGRFLARGLGGSKSRRTAEAEIDPANTSVRCVCWIAFPPSTKKRDTFDPFRKRPADVLLLALPCPFSRATYGTSNFPRHAPNPPRRQSRPRNELAKQSQRSGHQDASGHATELIASKLALQQVPTRPSSATRV
nr:hypothetical protein CFP56_12085 [Quercus suber]